MKPRFFLKIGAAAVSLLLATGPAFSGTPGEMPGQRFEVKFEDLPGPSTDSPANSSETIARPANATLRVPEGFSVKLFADNLPGARWLAVAPNGDVFLAQAKENKITLLRDADGDGAAEMREIFADGLERPHGLAFHGGSLYTGDLNGVWRIAYTNGALRAGDRTQVTPQGAFGEKAGNHWTRNIAFSPDGKYFFVAIGSASNTAEDPSPRATVQRFNADGSGQTTFASGVRNAVGIAFYPGTNDLYVVVNERDGLGDKLVPDYLTHLQEGAFYGWPYAYLGSHADPDYGARKPDMVAKAVAPDLLFEAHSAPLGLVFYEGEQFPAEYKGDAFVALHGSWNAGVPTGYKVVRVEFENGRPKGGYENFATGFWETGTDTAQVWGRPAGLAIAKDGSLLIADDAGKAVWRVSYGK